jgi:hypothetical protein
MKKLYEFTIYTEGEVDKIEKKTENGQEITVKTRIKDKIPHKFVLKQLARRENDEFRLFYGAQIKRGIDAGLLTEGVLMNKHIEGTGGLLSQETVKRVIYLNKKIDEVRDQLFKLRAAEPSEDRENKEIDLFSEFSNLNSELQSIHNSSQAIFGNTAEAYAKEKSNLWMILFQTYIDKDGKIEPYFKGKDYSEKEDFLFDLEDNNDVLFEALRTKLLVLWSNYSTGQVSKPEDFAKLEKTLDEEIEAMKKAALEEAEQKAKEVNAEAENSSVESTA